MLRPVLLVKVGLGGLVLATRWGESEGGNAALAPAALAPAELPLDEPTEAPGDFLRRHLEYELSGQFARSWDELHPEHQGVVSRERYARCRAELFARIGPGTELQVFDVLQVADDPAEIAGIAEPGSKAITAHIELGLNGNSKAAVDTMHAVAVDGRWAWVFPAGVYRAYASGSSPAEATA
jgi:hypothetical protein